MDLLPFEIVDHIISFIPPIIKSIEVNRISKNNSFNASDDYWENLVLVQKFLEIIFGTANQLSFYISDWYIKSYKILYIQDDDDIKDEDNDIKDEESNENN